MARHLLFAVDITLAWFFVLSVGAATAFLAARPVIRRVFRHEQPATVPLALRLIPSAVSLFGTIGLALPAFLWLEPLGSANGERLGGVASSLAVGGAALLVASLLSGARAITRTRRALRALARGAIHAEHPKTRVSLVVSDSPVPLMVLDGIVRPRLFVSRTVLDALTREEFDSAVAHELAHHAFRDNAKHCLLAFSPDIVGRTRLAREPEARWRQAAELKADAAASGACERDAVALASALVKVARLAAGRHNLVGHRAAFHDGRPVGERVRRLLTRSPGTPARRLRGRLVAVLAMLVAAAGTAAVLPATLSAVQRLTELLVHLP